MYIKKALATAVMTGALMAAGAGIASATPQPVPPGQAKQLPDTVDICNAPTKDNPDKKDTFIGIIKKNGLPLLAPLPLLKPETHLILGLCQEEEAKKGDEGGEKPAPAPAPKPGGDHKPAPAPKPGDGSTDDGNNGGGNDDPSNPSHGGKGGAFPLAASGLPL